MCFSATASFVTAGVLGAVGAVTLTRTSSAREIPLAATPLVLAVQQGIEGWLWLTLPVAPSGAMSSGLTLLFLLFAEVLWPLYAPLAALLVEPSALRRRLMLLCLASGVSVSGYMLWLLLAQSHGASIAGRHIVYSTAVHHSYLVGAAYLAATALPLLLSSRRAMVGLGLVILIGSCVAYVFYWQAFVSVWCFFAAAASAVILVHFERRYRLSALVT